MTTASEHTTAWLNAIRNSKGTVNTWAKPVKKTKASIAKESAENTAAWLKAIRGSK